MTEAPSSGIQNNKASSMSFSALTTVSTGPTGVYSTTSIVALIRFIMHTVDNAAPVKMGNAINI